MQTQNEHIKFVSSNGEPLVLQRLGVSGVLRDDLATIELEQVYRNAENVNIEATYTFPLPVGCVLLDLSVALNDRVLVGRIAPRVDAENEYEESLANGDTGIMLVELAPGLYQMNVGNLLPGDEARIRMRYAMPLKWEGGSLRLALPTTIAPRYGDAADAGLKPYEVPVTDALVENVYDLKIRIEGSLASLPISSPSHSIALMKAAGHTIATLSGGSALADRDFVLSLAASQPLSSSLRLASEGTGTVAHAVFRIPAASTPQPVVLKVLVDCSGSMNGDSMKLARACAVHALGMLERGDLFSASAFGSTIVHDPQFDGVLMPAGRDSPISHALKFVNDLDANLGGTELELALNSVYSLRRIRQGSEGLGASNVGNTVQGGDVLLITDGESWDHHGIVSAARSSGHRIYVIGIGSSPHAALVQDMARATGGSAVYVGPNEDIVPVVERQLARMRAPRVVDVKLDLPGQVRWRSPERIDSGVNTADTLHVFAMLDHVTGKAAQLTLGFANGGVQTLTAEPVVVEATGLSPNDLCRLGIAQRIAERLFNEAAPDEQELASLALEYRLHTAYTHYILTAERDSKAGAEQPALRQVPQMLAAGWGGTSTLFHTSYRSEGIQSSVDPQFILPRGQMSMISESRSSELLRTGPDPLMLGEMPAPYHLPSELTPAEFVDAFNVECNDKAKGINVSRLLLTIGMLQQMQVPRFILDDLEQLRSEGHLEESLVVGFLRAVLDSALGSRFERPARRRVIQLSVLRVPDPNWVVTLKVSLAGMTAEAWNWVAPTLTATPSLCATDPA